MKSICTLAALTQLCVGLRALAVPLFDASYNQSISFTSPGQLQQTMMTLAWDGQYYWNASGGGNFGFRLARLSNTGSVLQYYSPGLDFRSVFSDPAGNIYARQFADPTIYKQTSPGVFAPHVSLGGSLDAQSAIVLNSAGTEYIALNNGIVQRWDLSGTALPSVTLSGWGTVGSETSYPANRGVASLGGYWLTYTAGILSAWDANTGNRVDTTVLNGAGQTFDSYFSFSDANDMAFVADDSPSSLGFWRGYLIDLQDLSGDPGLPRVPDGGSTLVLLGVAVIGLAAVRFHGIA